MMLDADVVDVSPAGVWRVLKQAGLLSRWKRKPSRSTRSARSSISLSRKPRAIFAVSVSAVVFNVMGRADIHPVYDQTPADYSTFDRKITPRVATDGYRNNGRQGLDTYNSVIARPHIT